MQRTAIVVSKSLEPGEVANAAAIVMGQLAKRNPSLYGDDELHDTDGILHASIAFNVVVLRARPAQMAKCIELAKSLGIDMCAFNRSGRGLSNSHTEYAQLVQKSSSAELEIIAVGVTGSDEKVREACQGLSVYTG